LRFSYLEQVTKEKFLRAIVGDPPLIVDHQENIELESQLAEVKAVLKTQKEYVAQMVKELEERGRVLSRRKLDRNAGLCECPLDRVLKVDLQDTRQSSSKQLFSLPCLLKSLPLTKPSAICEAHCSNRLPLPQRLRRKRYRSMPPCH